MKGRVIKQDIVAERALDVGVLVTNKEGSLVLVTALQDSQRFAGIVIANSDGDGVGLELGGFGRQYFKPVKGKVIVELSND